MGRPVLPWAKVGPPTVLLEKFGKLVVSQSFRDPRSGAEVEYVLFGHADWATVLPITRDGLVVAVEQYKQGIDRVVLELPGGLADPPDEDPRELIGRELLEETGYQPDSVVSVGPPLYMDTRNSWAKYHQFLATGCRRVREPSFDAHEEIITRTFPIEEWVRLCLDEIASPSAVTTTFRALPHLGYRWVRGGAG